MIAAALALAVSVVALVVSLWLGVVSRRKASARAHELLRRMLTPEELVQLCEKGYLEVPSRNIPGRIYCVPLEPGLVTVMDNGVASMWLCAQPLESLPSIEEVLVHKFLLEGAESVYLRRANCFVRRSTTQVAVWTCLPPGVLGQR